MFEPIMRETKDISSEFEEILIEAKDLANLDIDSQSALVTLGQGWVAEEAFAMSYYDALKYPNNYLEAVR